MTRDIDSPDYRDSNVGEGMIPPRSATPKPRAGEHTKGLWRGGKARLHFEGDREVWAIFGRGEAPLATFPDVSDAEANARRIVVCVNACEAMDDPDAEIADVMENVRLLRIERDLLRERERELVEALTELAGDIEGIYDYCKRRDLMVVSIGQFRRLNAARALLAKHGR